MAVRLTNTLNPENAGSGVEGLKPDDDLQVGCGSLEVVLAGIYEGQSFRAQAYALPVKSTPPVSSNLMLGGISASSPQPVRDLTGE